LFVEVSAVLWTAVSALLRRDFGVSESLASEALEIAQREGYRLVESVSGMTQAVSRGLAGDLATAREATAELIGWLQRSNDSGNRSGSGLILSNLATLQLHADLPAEAEGTIAVGLALSQETGAFFNAELLRLRGEAALRRGERASAVGDFDAALELARSQQAASLVLRAATSKARVLRDEGRREEALALVTPALAGVNGGAGLPDRRDAEELIASVSG
jgi:tetratricopeptide (TPR) repeat protein